MGEYKLVCEWLSSGYKSICFCKVGGELVQVVIFEGRVGVGYNPISFVVVEGGLNIKFGGLSDPPSMATPVQWKMNSPYEVT